MVTELLARGYLVEGCGRDAEALTRARAVATAEAASVVPDAFHTEVCDLTDADQVERWIAGVVERRGRIDVAIHVAGIIQIGPLGTLTLGHFEQAMAIMAMAPIHLTLAVLPTMLAQDHGRIGIVSSVAAGISVPRLLPYCAAKAAAASFAEGMHAELTGTGVRVTNVQPWFMRTGSHLAMQFTGDAGYDYALFSPGASLPVLSMSVERAAKVLVEAVLAGRPVMQIGLLTKLVNRVHGLAPGLTANGLRLANRLLKQGDRVPRMTTSAPVTTGAEIRDRGVGRVTRKLTALGNSASARWNQDRQQRLQDSRDPIDSPH